MKKRKWKNHIVICCFLLLCAGTACAAEEPETENYIDETEIPETYKANLLEMEEAESEAMFKIEEIEIVNADSCDAATVDLNGTCGENAYWTLSADGVLKIIGSGRMDDYERPEDAPWYEWSDSVLKIDMSDSKITYLGANAFAGYRNNQSIEFSKETVEIGNACFWCQNSLEEVNFPDSLQIIGAEAFSGFTGLTKVFITPNIKQIGRAAFNSNKIQLFQIDSSNNFYSVIDQVLYSKDRKKLICYPGGKTDEIFYVPNQVLHISDFAFRNDYLEEIVLNDKLTQIGSYAFRCTNLKKINIPDAVEYIGSLAFESCSCLKEVSFAKKGLLKYLEAGCFYGCISLTNVVLPEGITRIETKVFADCSHLNSILLPSSVEYIDDEAFANCSLSKIQGFSRSCAEVWANAKNIPFEDLSHKHSFTKTIVMKAQTCTSAGAIQYHCDCGVNKVEATDALGHDSIYDASASRESTCSRNGVKVYRCSRCGLTTGTEILPRKEHSEGGIGYKVDVASESLVETHKCASCGKEMSRDAVGAVLAAEELEDLEEIGLAVGEMLAVDTWCAPTYVTIVSSHPAITVSKLDDRYVMLTANANCPDVLISFTRKGKTFSYHIPVVTATTQMQVTGAHTVSAEQSMELSVSRNADATDPISVGLTDSSVAEAEVSGNRIRVTGIAPGMTELIVTAGLVAVSYPVTVEKKENIITARAKIVKKRLVKGFYLKVSQTGDGKLIYKSDNKKVKVNKKGYVKVAKKFKGKVRITVLSEETENCKSAQKVITLTVK